MQQFFAHVLGLCLPFTNKLLQMDTTARQTQKPFIQYVLDFDTVLFSSLPLWEQWDAVAWSYTPRLLQRSSGDDRQWIRVMLRGPCICKIWSA